MNGHEKLNRTSLLYILIQIITTQLIICFIAVVGFQSYSGNVRSLEEKVLSRLESEKVSDIETALNFGKDFWNYYGMDEILEDFSRQLEESGSFVITVDGNLLYAAGTEERNYPEEIESFLLSDEFLRELPSFEEEGGGVVSADKYRAVFTPVTLNRETVGYFGCIVPKTAFRSELLGLRNTVALQCAVIVLLEGLALIILYCIVSALSGKKTDPEAVKKTIRFFSLMIMIISIILQSYLSLRSYRTDYRDRIESSVKTSLEYLASKMVHVSSMGVDLLKIEDLDSYISERVAPLEVLKTIHVTEQLSDEVQTAAKSDVLLLQIGPSADDSGNLYLEAKISEKAIRDKMMEILYSSFCTLIILLVFAIEFFKLLDLLEYSPLIPGNRKRGVPLYTEKQFGTALRLTSFLYATAEYMCVPYAAMMIRERGEALFGLTVGLTAALPLTMETFAQLAALLILPKFMKNSRIRPLLAGSVLLMAVSSVAIWLRPAALLIVLGRTLAGAAYAGLKQVSNYMIVNGYETETGRSVNISQNNAGLLAGSTCGAALGAVIAGASDVRNTFLASVVFFFISLIVMGFYIPLNQISERADQDDTEDRASIRDIARLIFSREMFRSILQTWLPLNVGAMFCVTVIPAICQVKGIASIILSGCYIMNGLAGIYLGPALVHKGRDRFGPGLCLAFTFALTAAAVFILQLSPIVIMLMASSFVFGFLDGFGTPIATDMTFSKIISRKSVNKITALLCPTIVTYILMAFTPMISELFLLPGKGIFTPWLAGAVIYAGIAVSFLAGSRRKE